MTMARAFAILAVLGLLAPAPALAKPPVVKRTIGGPGAKVPRSFAGFSIEYPSVPDYFGRSGSPNRPFIRLLRTLGAAGVGAPTIHIGGESADESWGEPDGLFPPPGGLTDLFPH